MGAIEFVCVRRVERGVGAAAGVVRGLQAAGKLPNSQKMSPHRKM